MGYSLWGHKESDVTEHAHVSDIDLIFHFLSFSEKILPSFLQMYLLTKQKEPHRLRDCMCCCLCTLLYLKWITDKALLEARGSLLRVMQQPGWEAGLGESGYMCMYG